MSEINYSFANLGALKNYAIDDVIEHLKSLRNEKVDGSKCDQGVFSKAGFDGTELGPQFSDGATLDAVESHNVLLIVQRMKESGKQVIALNDLRPIHEQVRQIAVEEGLVNYHHGTLTVVAGRKAHSIEPADPLKPHNACHGSTMSSGSLGKRGLLLPTPL